MTKLKEVYDIVRDMLKYAEAKNKNEVLAHNDFFEAINKQVEFPEELFFTYDNCRQSCFLAMINLEKYDVFMAEARRLFALIPRP